MTLLVHNGEDMTTRITILAIAVAMLMSTAAHVAGVAA
jgi:hypothetical protein